MNDPTMTQLFKEMDDVWGRFSRHIETITAKPNHPPRPTDEQLLDWGVRIVGDAPRVPKKGELYFYLGVVTLAAADHAHDELLWIVEPDPYAEARKAYRDRELQVLQGPMNEWTNWHDLSDDPPDYDCPPEHYRRKPKEPQGKWVECEVEYNCVNVLSFDSPWNDVDTRVTDAPSIKGFGGYLYDGRWSLRMKSENNPPTNGAVIIKPEKVRFWVTKGGK